MKEIFLSFRPEYFKPLLYGIKKYEYRRIFCNEEVKAYLYLSGKVRKVVGIVNLGKPIRLDLTRDNYVLYPDTLKRVDDYIATKDINAVPIKSFILFKNPITLEELRESIPNFMSPQMYFILNNNKKLKEIVSSQELDEILFNHKHDKIYYDNLAMSVSELEKTEEFKKLDNLYKNDKRFNNLKKNGVI